MSERTNRPGIGLTNAAAPAGFSTLQARSIPPVRRRGDRVETDPLGSPTERGRNEGRSAVFSFDTKS